MGEGEEVDNGANPRIELKRELDCTVKEKGDNGANPRIELKRELDSAVKEEAELGASPPKKQVKLGPSETATDDDGVSPWSELRENENVSSLETSTSLPFEMGTGSSNSSDNNQASSLADVTSESSGNSCLVSCSDERGARNRDHGRVSTSQISLEIPKHVSTTGIRKITFKFTKSKEEYESKLSTTPAPLGPSNGLQHEADSIIDSSDELGFGLDYSSSNRFLYNNMELKMSKKVVPDSYPNNVKKLLATGILEGARVKYISTSGEKEITGEIRGSGYLCGCVACNYTNVLSAYEFEQHAGGSKTRHPNNHIFLENGRPIYSIIEGLKTAPLGILEELVKEMAGSSFNEGWKASLQQCDGMAPADKKHQRKSASMYPAHLSLANRPTDDEQKVAMRRANPSKYLGKRSSFSNSYSVLSHKKSGDISGGKKRDNDLHRLLFMPNGLPDGAKLAYYAKGQKVLEGYKHGNGIVCGHCSIEISPSQFEAHAGWAARRQPYRHIYTSNGLTLHDLAMSLSRGQNLTTGSNDDMCTICGDRGELIPCGGCPRAYHQSCLGLPLVPDSDWCCSNCNDRKTDVWDSSSNCKPIIFRLTRVVKTSEVESGGCVLCRENDFSVEKFDERTVIICDQCEKEYHVGCLRTAGRCDLRELPKDKWFCCNDCERIHCALKDLVLKGSETISSSESFKISKKLLDKGLSPLGDNDVHWHVLSGKCRHPEHLPLLSKAVSIFRECFSPITAMGGRDLIPVMVHGRNISGQEFGGMYCVLLTVKSVVVSAGLLRIFGREVAELPLVATSKEYQGKGYFLALFSLIEKLLHSLNVENLVLPAAEKAKSMWVNRFGFKDMGPERLCAYARELQLTEFKGTVMLEKKVEPLVDSS